MMAFRIAHGVRSHFIHRLPEWLLAGQIGMMGMQLLRVGSTFGSSPTWRVIARVISEDAFGSLALGISLFWLISLILNGTFWWFAGWSRWVRSLSAFLATGFWSVTAIGLYQASPYSTGVTNNAGFAVMSFVVSLITAREVGAADKRARNAAAGT